MNLYTFIVDAVVVAIVAISVIVGYKRGLVLSLISTLSLVIAIVAGYFLMPPVSSMIAKTGLQGKAETAIYNIVLEGSETLADKASVSAEELMENSQLPAFVKNAVDSIMSVENKEGGFEETASKIAVKASSASMKIVSFLIVFLIVSIGLCIVKLLWKGIKELPVIHQFDSAGGFLFGLVFGVLIVCCLMLLVGALYSLGILSNFTEVVRNSFFGSLFYEHNILGIIISAFVK